MWYRYPDQASNSRHSHGTGTQPSLIGRVLDGGASQVTTMTYNAKGMMTSKVDPVGRQANYTYATNGIDLLTVEQVRSGGTDTLQTFADYTSRRLPETITDAAGQTSTVTYNAAGQPLTVTNTLSQTTTFTYDSISANLLTVTGPVSGATTTYTYDGYGRVATVTDAEGYQVAMTYDALDRLTQVTYPDATTETWTYSRQRPCRSLTTRTTRSATS